MTRQEAEAFADRLNATPGAGQLAPRSKLPPRVQAAWTFLVEVGSRVAFESKTIRRAA